MRLPFFTIGHSNPRLEEFVALLDGDDIDFVANIRTVPRSRANSQFDKDTLPAALAAFHVSYEHVAALGGLRGQAKTLSPDVNGFWTNERFHNYADYALTRHFHAGPRASGRTGTQATLRDDVLGSRMVAVPPAHCRRSSDRRRGNCFSHYGAGPPRAARLTVGAVIQRGGRVVYPGVERSDP